MCINSGQVDFSGCNIYNNEASGVSHCPALFHGPNGSSFQELSHRARREAACTSSMAQR